MLNPGPEELQKQDVDELHTFVPYRLSLYIAGQPSHVYTVLQVLDSKLHYWAPDSRIEWIAHVSLQEEFSRLLQEAPHNHWAKPVLDEMSVRAK